MLADEQEALHRVATLVARRPSPTEVFGAVAEEVGRLLDFDAVLLLVYGDEETATVAASWSVGYGTLPTGAQIALEVDGVGAIVFRTERPTRIDDYAAAEGSTAAYVRTLGIGAAVGIPIVVEGRLWGVLIGGSVRPEPMPEGAESRLVKFTELVATAISNTEAATKLERVAAEQAALRRVATLVAQSAPSDEIFAAVTEQVVELFGVVIAGLFRYERGPTVTVIAGAGDWFKYVGDVWNFAEDDPSVLTTIWRTGRPARIDSYEGVGGAGQPRVDALNLGSAVGVPLVVDGRLWGAMTTAVTRGQPLLPTDTFERLAAFAELATTALANAEARTEIGRLADEQAALRRVATLVARGVPPNEVFAAVAEEVGRILDVDDTTVMRYETDETGTIVAVWGRETVSPLGSRWNLEGDSVVGRVLRTGHSARMDDYSSASGEIAELSRRLGRRSAVGAPIIVDGRLWGAAMANSNSVELPAAAEGRIANFTELIAIAISNTEARTELTASRARVVAAADDARRRLERDLHDGIQQRLVSLALEVRTAAAMTPTELEELQNQLSSVADGLSETLEELRELSRGIHPAVLSEGGLEPALRALARRSAITVTLDLALEPTLPERVGVAAYFVASEGLANVAKHAEASAVALSARCSGESLTLSIQDDGVGGADPVRGTGLIGLNDRVAAVGGTISVASPTGEGTSLRVTLPLND
jgi:signal transduction histidine kinase